MFVVLLTKKNKKMEEKQMLLLPFNETLSTSSEAFNVSEEKRQEIINAIFEKRKSNKNDFFSQDIAQLIHLCNTVNEVMVLTLNVALKLK
jgi:hypothetical protein